VINYRSANVAPLPIAELLARSSLSQLPHSSRSDASSCADDDPSCVQRAVTKRQVDPLHSCIEAKCSSWNSGNYLDCVYRHCISGFQVHGKRSTDTDEPDADSFDHPEGRFLLLPVTFQNSDVEQQLFPPNILTPGDEVDEERRARVARARLARRGMSASREDNRHIRAALASKHDRMKRNVVEWGDKPVDRVAKSGSLARRLRAGLLPKRSYNDIADVCIEHHCGQLPPHSISYFQCVDYHCTGKRV